jgi:hypothetical protein
MVAGRKCARCMAHRREGCSVVETLVLLSRVGLQRIARVIAGAAFSPLGLFALPVPATAHPSDFETLTLDLLVGPRGLEVIDAAVVESGGPSYEPFPTSDVKRDVALKVLGALDVASNGVVVDPEVSARYHEVGFLVRFKNPSLGAESPLRIDTTELQELVADETLSRLKLSVCGVAEGANSPDPGALSALDIRATQPGRPPAGLDREACEVWTLTPSDQPVSIVVKPKAAAETGVGVVRATVTALIVLVVGAALLALVPRIRRRTRLGSDGGRQQTER